MIAVLKGDARLSKRKKINWSEGEAKTQQEIDERVAKKMLNNPTFLEALMQESFAKEHINIIPIGFNRK